MGRGQLYQVKTKRRRVNKGRLFFLLILCSFLVTVLLGMRLMNVLNAIQDNSVWAKSLPAPKEGEREHYFAYAISGGSNPTMVEAVFIAYNPAKQKFRAIHFPVDTLLEIPGQGPVLLSRAYELAGKDGIIRTVADLLTLDIHYYIEVNEDELPKTVDRVGGLELPEHMFLNRGGYVLDLIYAEGLSAADRLEHRRLILAALAARVAAGNWLQKLKTLHATTPLLTTNLNWRKLLITLESLKHARFSDTTKMLVLPGSEQIAPDGSYWKINEQQLPAVVSWLDDDISSLPRAEITIEVLNGCGVRGIATLAASILESEGFSVVRVGNADHYDYPVSLVISRTDFINGAREVATLIPGADMRKEEIAGWDVMVTVIIGKNYPKE
jgi:anionic cell wall polymer biosynthesis LytR-Cps2A-Psr (LCP) family protein